MNILLVAALLPAIALMAYVYRKDRAEPEPIGLVARVFLIGALTGPIAGLVEGVLFEVFEAVIPAGVFLIFVQYFLGVAVVEEACKYFSLNTIRKNPEFNYVFDAVVYSVAAALGFAALENVLYVFDGGIEVAVTRAIFSVPGHMADGVVMGVFFGLARQRELHGNAAGARSFYLLAFLLPVIEHGFYDAALSLDSDFMAFVAMATDLAFIAVAFALIHNVSKNDMPLHPSLVSNAAPTRASMQPGQQSQIPVQPPYAGQPYQAGYAERQWAAQNQQGQQMQGQGQAPYGAQPQAQAWQGQQQQPWQQNQPQGQVPDPRWQQQQAYQPQQPWQPQQPLQQAWQQPQPKAGQQPPLQNQGANPYANPYANAYADAQGSPSGGGTADAFRHPENAAAGPTVRYSSQHGSSYKH